MPRAPFNKTCTIYRGTDETKIDVPFAVGVDCRRVVQDGIISFGTDSLPTNYYLTISDVEPLGSWDFDDNLDLTIGDWILFEGTGLPLHTVVYVRDVDWNSQPIYYQGHLVPYRHVRRIADGGVLLGGSAHVTTTWSGSGGVIVGGSAVVSFVHRLSVVGSGGVRLGGDACPYQLTIVHNNVVVPVVGAGGIVVGGSATITNSGGGLWLWDGFNHDSGDYLNGTSLEAGDGLPATWMVFNQNMFGTGTEATEEGYVLDIFNPGVMVCEANKSDGVCELGMHRLLFAGSCAGGMVIRYLDAGNFLHWQYDDLTTTAAFYSFVGGTPTLLNSTGITISTDPDNPTIFRAVMTGDNVDCWIDGGLVYSVTDSYNNLNTQHGVTGYRRVGYFDGYMQFTYWQFTL